VKKKKTDSSTWRCHKQDIVDIHSQKISGHVQVSFTLLQCDSCWTKTAEKFSLAIHTLRSQPNIPIYFMYR
jgi:hypothetical protein